MNKFHLNDLVLAGPNKVLCTIVSIGNIYGTYRYGIRYYINKRPSDVILELPESELSPVEDE